MVPTQKHGFHPGTGPFHNPHMEVVHNSDGFSLSSSALPSQLTILSATDTLSLYHLCHFILTYSPSIWHYAPHPILYILARIIFRLAWYHISPLLEALTDSAYRKKYQWATSLLGLTSLFFPPPASPWILQNITQDSLLLTSPGRAGPFFFGSLPQLGPGVAMIYLHFSPPLLN